jgi:hypothetical protein
VLRTLRSRIALERRLRRGLRVIRRVEPAACDCGSLRALDEAEVRRALAGDGREDEWREVEQELAALRIGDEGLGPRFPALRWSIGPSVLATAFLPRAAAPCKAGR